MDRYKLNSKSYLERRFVRSIMIMAFPSVCWFFFFFFLHFQPSVRKNTLVMASFIGGSGGAWIENSSFGCLKYIAVGHCYCRNIRDWKRFCRDWPFLGKIRPQSPKETTALLPHTLATAIWVRGWTSELKFLIPLQIFLKATRDTLDVFQRALWSVWIPWDDWVGK